MRCRREVPLAIVLGLLCAGGHSAAHAASPAAQRWQLRQLLEPAQAQLAMEAKGRVQIYSGLTDRQVREAMNRHFDRIDNMMFVRVVITDAEGNAARDENSGETRYENDGCD